MEKEKNLKDILSEFDLSDIMYYIKDKYDLDDILSELPSNEILNNIPEDERLESLKYSWILEEHDNDVKNDYYDEIYDEIYDKLDNQLTEEFKNKNIKYLDELKNFETDNLRRFFCDLFGISYYDDNELFEGFVKLFEILEKSTYKDSRERPWKLLRN